MISDKNSPWIAKILPHAVREAIFDLFDPFKRKKWAQAIAQQTLSVGHRKTVVDLGCGPQPCRSIFQETGWHYVGIDRGIGDPQAEYHDIDIKADLARLPLADNIATTALSLVTLEHLPQPHLALAEAQRVLAPGGRLYLAAPQLWETHQAPNDYFRFTRYGLRRLAEDAGFEVLEIQPVGGYFQLMGYRLLGVVKYLQRPWLLPLFFLLFPILFLLVFLPAQGIDRLLPDPDFTLGHRLVARKPLPPDSTP